MALIPDRDLTAAAALITKAAARVAKAERDLEVERRRRAEIWRERNELVERAEKAEAEIARLVREGEWAQGVAAVTPCSCSAQRARAEKAEAALRDLADHGTRHDLNPTMPGGNEGMTHLLRYIERMDQAVRDRARAALDGE